MNNNNNENPPSPIEFPCDFVIKVVGKSSAEFIDAVLMIVHRHFPSFGNGNLKKRYSKNTNYLSLTIIVHPENQEQLDNLYRELSSSPDIMMVF